ncbi:Plant regulator RWP-RK family protein [Rhynchospora pubera]|uniref:Plant regulator RWP-RK family protein n=1 Tax=Rhynchospora pubera TaxID=906938 RepID=A0AAV8GND9_9POAL|nr:Plant regulator RWP-RK family protein [Rhynchospora pubera]
MVLSTLPIDERDGKIRALPEAILGRRAFIDMAPVLKNKKRTYAIRVSRSKRHTITFEHLSGKFHMPMAAASKSLAVSKSTLKLRCRELGILVWPYRKLSSLEKLINKVVELAHPGFQFIVCNIRQEIEAIKMNPSLKIKNETECLRRAMYDLHYKKRRDDSRVAN